VNENRIGKFGRSEIKVGMTGKGAFKQAVRFVLCIRSEAGRAKGVFEKDDERNPNNLQIDDLQFAELLKKWRLIADG
jgi:hypothetical protein